MTLRELRVAPRPLFAAAFGVSATKSEPEQSSVSPQMCRRLKWRPTSWVAVRPRSNGAWAVHFVPMLTTTSTVTSRGTRAAAAPLRASRASRPIACGGVRVEAREGPHRAARPAA